jgi:protoheme IX farnesyltransferase
MSIAPPATVVPHLIARWQDYLGLLKPRVMSLAIFTAFTGMVCAPTPIDPILGAVAILCIAIGAGGAAALNMGYDSDIDAIMRRTRRRPVPAGRVQRSDALGLGVILSMFSVAILGLCTNWLAAGLLAFTIFFYVAIYTLWLKRRTPQNIVVGGLAGALPPLVGWAAASGTLPLNAWLLVAMIFIWTPPHFWALALYTQEDYAKAGVPMMPVAKGAASTRLQILLYSLVLIPLCVAPAFTGLGGPIYLAISVGGGLAFIALAVRLSLSLSGDTPGDGKADKALYDVKAATKPARDVFAYSILYLFCLFATLLCEHLAHIAPLTRTLALGAIAWPR